jgi:hypothetical protein
MFTIPDWALPNSAVNPPVMTRISAIASMSIDIARPPSTGSEIDIPSTVNTSSLARPPRTLSEPSGARVTPAVKDIRPSMSLTAKSCI